MLVEIGDVHLITNQYRILRRTTSMYDESEYICQEFRRHFAEKKQEPIVLYGIGKYTGELLEKNPEYRIIGLMDGKRKEGKIFGKSILDYAEVQRLKVRTIVIVARPAVIGVIYHRIAEFCKKNSIVAYDVRGNDLSKHYVDQENDIPYFTKNFHDLKEEIEKHKVISFDVFDTLIMRKVLYPTDIFSIVEKRIQKKKLNFSFTNLRIEAEKILYKKKINPTLEEIYRKLQELSGISKECREELLASEIAVEMECIIPRKKMLELYNDINVYKKIYCISDMYLPQKIIVEMLHKCGYHGFDKIYVSCENRKSKSEGLFKIFAQEIEDEGYRRQDCLHIGDNYVADIMSAKSEDLDTFQIMNAREMLESSSYRKVLAEDLDFVDHLMLGQLCERAFNDPFVLYETKGKLKIDNLHDFSFILIAPMILSFTVWLMQQIYRFQCEYVLYPSRDAYLIQKICKMICVNQYIKEFPDGEYFYTSRRAILAATIWDETDIYRVIEPDYFGNISQLFKQRFGITIEQSGEDVKAEDREGLMHYIEKYKQDILEQSKKERKNYISYISDTGLLKYDKIAFIDFVAAGKVQNGLEKLIPEKDIQGFYFLRRDPDKSEIDKEIKVESFFPSKGAYEIDSNVYKYYLFLEMILTSPESTFHSISDEGHLRFMKESRTKRHCEIVNIMQESILEYTETFSRLCPDLLEQRIDWKIPDIILGFLDQEYTTLDMEEMTSMILTDEFLGQTFNIFHT